MSTNPQPSKQSRWGVGSFFQQAVAGVESRLDTILADPDDETPAKDTEKTNKQAEQPALQQGMSFSKPTSGAPSRSPSTKANDRLQERLARAVVRRNSQGNTSSTGVPSRTASPYAATDGRSSLDSSAEVRGDDAADSTKGDNASVASSGPRPSVESAPRSSKDIESDRDSKGRQSQEQSTERETKPATENGTGTTRDIPQIGVTSPPSENATDYEAAMAQLQADHEASELRWQEELHEYTERIDALQSKVKYLAKEAAESAKIAAASAEPGSMERKLLEKDEQIAALMEEGQKLSKTELDHRATIKKLRQHIAENTKSQEATKKRTEKLEKDLAAAQNRAKRAEALERQSSEKITALLKKEKQLDSVTAERNASNAAISDLKDQLAKAVARAEAAERKAQTDSVEAERRQVAELKDDLSSAKIEREISEEKLRREIKDLKEGIEREKERARVLEIELRNEQSVLESKMESLRSRAEEASSSATGDAQAKLLRQIETLQTQYAVASENWHGIEGSLVSRLSGVEAERDEIARREGDLRRKLREASLKAKRSEGDVENTREVVRELEQNLEESKQKIDKLTQRIAKADEDLATARQDLAKQREIAELKISQRVEEERSKWQEQALASPLLTQQVHTESPVASLRKSSYHEAIGTPSDRPASRRSSALPLPLSELSSPPRQNSYSSLNSNPALRQSSFTDASAVSDAPMHLSEPEEYFNGLTTPITPSAQGTHTQHSRGINDIISVSTVGAGPSVQLVERMSATVRRLESERAASKDELARLTSQRDEARQEVVELMREVEEKRDSDKKVQELESKLEDLDQRYQTTLEMLGEKSEQVEELKADIADLKKIYRELVDSTMK